MLYRKIIKELEAWRAKNDNKALLIKGARQVGKTTIVREFAKKNYKHFVEINFEKMPSVKQAFDGNLDAKTITLYLSAMGFGPFVKGETLVFFDEIQSCPNARTAIKFLVEDGSYHYIESGSLLGINYSDVSSYPVGFERHISMFPLDFEEFLLACGVSIEVIERVKEYYYDILPVPEFIHEQMMGYLRKYLIVGGMPEVVSKFISDNDFNECVKLQKDIIESYRDDISKYAGNQKNLAKYIFDSIPEQLCKENKRFVLADIEKGASNRKYGGAIQWLTDAGDAYLSFNVNSFELPFSLTRNSNLYKLLMLDTGLLCSMCLDGLQYQVLNGNIGINEGALTENLVGTELVKKGIPLYYYDKKSRQELDFIFPENNKISIIEVKSGNDYKRHFSLNRAIEENHAKIERAMVFSKFNVENRDGILYYPLYMIMFI